jgi:RING-like zinc finger
MPRPVLRRAFREQGRPLCRRCRRRPKPSATPSRRGPPAWSRRCSGARRYVLGGLVARDEDLQPRSCICAYSVTLFLNAALFQPCLPGNRRWCCAQELDELDVLGGGEDDSEHPITAAAACRKDNHDVDDDLFSADVEAGNKEGRRPLDVEAGGGGAVAAGLDDDEEQRKGERATLGSESADLSMSFGDGTSSSRAWIRVPSAAGQPQDTSQDRCRYQRLVPSQCAICLSSMALKDNVTWSSNPNCQHVFHYRCVPNWFGRCPIEGGTAPPTCRIISSVLIQLLSIRLPSHPLLV